MKLSNQRSDDRQVPTLHLVPEKHEKKIKKKKIKENSKANFPQETQEPPLKKSKHGSNNFSFPFPILLKSKQHKTNYSKPRFSPLLLHFLANQTKTTKKRKKKIFPIKRNTSQGFIGRIQERESEEKNEKPEKSVEREGEKDSMYDCEVADVRAWVRTGRSSPRGDWNQLKS